MSGLFKSQKLPKPEPVAPLPDEEQIAKAKRRRISQETGRDTRASVTDLSGGKRETLG